MSLEGLNCFGPNHNDWRLAEHASQATSRTDWDLPLVTNAGSHSPPGSIRWVEADDGGTVTETLVSTLADSTFTLKDFVWYPLRAFRLQGTIVTGNTGTIYGYARSGDFVTAEWRWSSSGKVNFGIGEVGSVVTWGTSEYTFDANTSLLIEYTTSNVKLYVNDVLEVTASAVGRAPLTTGFVQLFAPTTGISPLHYWSGIGHGQSDTESDRPKATTLFVHGGPGTSDGTDGDYKDETYDGAGNAAVFGDVALDGSDQVDVSTYWKAKGADAWAQTVHTTDPNNTHPLFIGVHRSVCAGTLGLKTLNTSSRIRDGGDTADIANANIDQTAWESICLRHTTAPNGGSWQDYDPADFEFGVVSDGGNNDNDEWAGMIFELAEVESEGVAGGQPAMRRFGGVPGMTPGGLKIGRSWP